MTKKDTIRKQIAVQRVKDAVMREAKLQGKSVEEAKKNIERLAILKENKGEW